jgi:hypothetical protein
VERIQDPTILYGMRPLAGCAEGSQVRQQLLELGDPPSHLSNVTIDDHVDVAAVLIGPTAKVQQCLDLVMCHVERTTVKNEGELGRVRFAIQPIVAVAPSWFGHEAGALVISNRLDRHVELSS